MMASKMTNEELASRIGTEAARDEVMFGETKGREMFAEICAEAAKRLRRPTPVDDDLLKMARDIEAKDAEIAELRELLIELANAANTAFDDIAKCGSIISDGDVRDAAYRTHLMERIAKYRQVLKGKKDESK